ncbi:hypothetical protein PRZ48_008045 [Zasmidium cellare]|uniref:Ubiquitin-like domain-containing protein n=1 Tax=Zasmidium cellare TaxID=395010 RepID=A0ABR0EER0_ZASCE|nr:hypothetical protein PRZ48_008045 [Zasmidium cellare]
MSVKFTVELELPIEDFVLIQAGLTTVSTRHSAQAAVKATLEAIRATPYQDTSAFAATLARNSAALNHRATSGEPAVPIHITSLNGKPVTITTPLSTTIPELRLLVENETGISPHKQCFVFAGRQLPSPAVDEGNDMQSLESFGVQRDSVINLILKLGAS